MYRMEAATDELRLRRDAVFTGSIPPQKLSAGGRNQSVIDDK